MTKNEELFISKLREGISLQGKYTNAKTKVILSCTKGHTWEVIPSNLVSRGNGNYCKFCTPKTLYNKKSTYSFSEELKELFPEVELVGEYINSREKVTLKCSQGHTWEALPTNIISHNSGGKCPICTPPNTRSKLEIEMADYIAKEYSGELLLNDKSFGTEIDVIIPELAIGFEFNGLYYHQEAKRGKDLHRYKTDLLKDYGFNLIQVNEDEWVNKLEIVKSRIRYILGKTYTVGARECTIKSINFPLDFLEANHIQGAGAPSSINYGLFFKDELVAVMTFSKPKFSTVQDYELVRYCSLTGINVVGGASKLLKHFRKNYIGSIVSYSDRRWSSGGLYKALGFEYSHTSTPNYKYYKNLRSLSRYKCQKHKLKDLFPEYYDEHLTEKEIMKLAGYYPVYDSGSDVWVLK